MRAFLAALMLCACMLTMAATRPFPSPAGATAVERTYGHRAVWRRHPRLSHRLHVRWSQRRRRSPTRTALAGNVEERSWPARAGLTRARLADGQIITVAAAYAARFVGFLDALFAREGRLPHVGCYAPSGHMPGSLHHWGGACDVGQIARNVAWPPMYHVGALARQYGLTDGCVWRKPDCGHVDVSGIGGAIGVGVVGIGGRARYASHHRRRHQRRKFA